MTSDVFHLCIVMSDSEVMTLCWDRNQNVVILSCDYGPSVIQFRAKTGKGMKMEKVLWDVGRG